MPRLFIALDLPQAVTAQLCQLQPSASAAGIRLAKPDQLHLTLHFLGESEIAPVVSALTGIQHRLFSLVLEGVGKFPPDSKAKVLWVGIQPHIELLSLHAAIGTALDTHTGYQVESRPYAPHITLARCGFKTPAHVADELLARHAKFALPPVPIDGFALYSSTSANDGPVYKREHWFPFE